MTKNQLPSYTNYKDSGIWWLDKLPQHWALKRLKEVSDIQNSNVDKKSYDHEVSVRLCNYVDVYKNEFINSSLDFMQATADESEIRKFALAKDDILITKDSETFEDIAVPALVTENIEGVICGYHLAQIKAKNRLLLGSYLFRLFQSKQYGFRFSLHAKGFTRFGLGQSAINDALTPIPPLPEQQAIADYLDAKTAQIDRKVDLLEQKAEKYVDLKQSLINETVTCGLDKTVPMKDSGVEWIGQVPKHWEVKRVKDLFIESKNKVGSRSGLYKILSLTQNGVIERDIENGKGKFPATFDGYQIVNPDSLLLCLFDMDVTPRIIGYVDQIGLATSAYTNIVGNTDSCAKYYYFYFLNQDRNKSLLANGKGLRSTITFDNFGLLKIPFPPLEEQKAIAEYLKSKTMLIERIVGTINAEIEKLKELRKTLINDVVTGKIKVTGRP